MQALWIILPLLLLGVAVAYGASLYNVLVKAAVNVDKSWANITVLEKQRYEELPRLVEICKGYMKYEQETLERITLARAQFLAAQTPPAMAKADVKLEGALKTLFANVENYPDLKAHETFLRLQKRITGLECEIADRREFYNDAVAIFNTRIAQVPYTFVAELAGFAPVDMYQVPEEETAPVAVRFGGER